jgi:hypothetical protein
MTIMFIIAKLTGWPVSWWWILAAVFFEGPPRGEAV